MFAIMETGGKQYKVSVGDLVDIEKIEAEVGSKVNFNALMIVDGEEVKNGNPYIENAGVVAEVVKHDKQKKIIVVKYKAKKHTGKRQGHRQPYTTVKILEIK